MKQIFSLISVLQLRTNATCLLENIKRFKCSASEHENKACGSYPAQYVTVNLPNFVATVFELLQEALFPNCYFKNVRDIYLNR